MLNSRRLPFLSANMETISHAQKQEALALRFSEEQLPRSAYASGILIEIILKACAYDREQRYKTAAEFRADLCRVLE